MTTARTKQPSGAAWLVAGMVLVPYATVFLPFQLGLRVQAGLIVAALAVAAWGGRRALLRPGRLLPDQVRLGLGLYAAAAVWGAAVGMLAGNPARFVASQLLSMTLLVAAAFAFSLRRDLNGEALVVALGWAAVAALGLHVAAFVAPQLAGEVPGHFGFDLRNSIGAGGLAPLIWLLGLAWACAGSQWRRLAVPVSGALLCVWSESRGAWVSALIGSAVVILLVTRRPGRTVVLASGAALVLAGVAVAARALAVGSGARPGTQGSAAVSAPVRLDSWAGAETVGRTMAAQAFDGVALEISARSKGDRGSHLWVWAEFADATGRSLGTKGFEVVGAGRWTRWASLVAAPPAARSVRAGVSLSPGQGTWLVEGVDLLAVRSQLGGLGRELCLRISSLGDTFVDPVADGSLSYRIAESRAVRAVWERAGPARRLAGFGLGATFAFPNTSFDAEGRRIVVPVASYIHDFYLFLLFKLGLAGAAALAGLVVVVWWTASAAVGARGRPERQWLLAGAAAAWLAYLVWSVTSPEIYDFRVAPLWGVVIAACCREAGAGNGGSPIAGAPAASPVPPAARQGPRLWWFSGNGRPR